MRFDARTLVAAIETPVFVALDGTEFPTRPLSHIATSRFLEKIQAWGKGGVQPVVVEEEVRELCEAVGVPWERVIELPEDIYQQWLASFLAYLSRTRFGAPTAAPPSTSASS